MVVGEKTAEVAEHHLMIWTVPGLASK